MTDGAETLEADTSLIQESNYAIFISNDIFFMLSGEVCKLYLVASPCSSICLRAEILNSCLSPMVTCLF